METQKTPIAKAVLRKKNGAEESTLLISDFTSKIQPSRQYGTGTKTETYMSATGQKAQR